MAYTPLRPSVWAGVGTNISTNVLLSNYDLPPFEEVKLIAETTERQMFFDSILKVYGMTRGVDTIKVGHAQIQRPFENIKFDNIVSGGGVGADMTVRVDAAFMYTPTLTNGGAAVKASPARKWDIIRVGGQNVWIKDKITVGAQHNYVLSPLDGTFDLASTITVGTLATNEYAVVSSMYPEGSDVREGLLPRIRKYTNDFQTIKEAIKWTGTEATVKVYHTNTDGVSGAADVVYLKPNMMMSYERKRSYALLVGQKNTNANIAGYQNPELGYDSRITATEGFITFAEKEGHDDPVTFATYTVDDIRRLALILEQSYSSHTTDYLYLYSQQVGSAIAKELLAKFNNTADRYLEMIYGQISGKYDKFNFNNAEGFGLKLGFRSVQVDNYTFTFRSLHEFNDLKGLGNEVKFQKYAMAIPMGYTKDANDGDAEMPLMGYQFRKQGAYSRETVTGAWSGMMAQPIMDSKPSSGWDVSNLAVGCEIGFHGYCGNQIVIQHE